MKLVVKLIKKVTPEIQKLVDAEFAKVEGNPHPNSALNQVNLLGGDKIVYEYMDYGELGLAFDHLTYMFTETGIELVPSLRQELTEIAKILSLTQ